MLAAVPSTAQAWIRRLGLRPHPEGGHYRETYRSAEQIAAAHLPRRFGGARTLSTAIYYLLRAGERSALHRIKSDEIWHHYAGDVVIVWMLDEHGSAREARLGADGARAGEPQLVVPAGVWYGARLADGGDYALLGGTVAPGFEFADFELADGATLRARHPRHAAWIAALT